MEPHTDMVINGTERRSKGSAICIAYVTEGNQAKPRLGNRVSEEDDPGDR
jgi:hypothetical protein